MNWLYSSLHTLCISFALFCSADTVSAGETQWRFIRDGVLHIRQHQDATEAGNITIGWRAAWIPNSQRETLYWLDSNGSLLERTIIEKDNNSGKAVLTFPQKAGDYYLEIPGAGYRFYQVNHAKAHTAVFEPAKVHQSASIEKGVKLYFRVPANTAFTLNGKYYGGVKGLKLKAMASGSSHKLKLRESKEYSDFQSLEITAHHKEQIWQLSFKGAGKTSFWLDGIPNLFAQSPDHYFLPDWKKGSATVSIDKKAVGKSPKLGAALPHVNIPEHTHDLLKSLHLEAGNYYFYDNLLKKNLGTDLEFMKTYQSVLGLEEGISIRAETGRKPIVSDKKKSAELLEGYLNKHNQNGTLQQGYIAIVDEPNLNYETKNEFISDYTYIVEKIKSHPNAAIARTKFAAPQSSRFINGPTRPGSEQRIGIDWLTSMLEQRPDLVDAISWHEWLIRDLIATEWYDFSVSTADSLRRKYPNADKSLKPLIISQTNISSGKSISPYEQDTFFAALWWSSVVCQAAKSGQLDQLVWFKAADDGEYNKGFIKQDGSGFSLKPAGKAQAFLGGKLENNVLAINNPSVELDLLATSSDDRLTIQLLGVNKSRRDYSFSIKTAWLQNYKIESIEALNEAGEFEFPKIEMEKLQSLATITIPAQTIFAVRYKK